MTRSDHFSRATAFTRHLLARFSKDEEGGIIIMTVVLLGTMLLVSGMAVDFMRLESQRAKLQGIADRSVLASASLFQTQTAKDVIESYHQVAEMDQYLKSDGVETRAINGREVELASEAQINTFFLQLIGSDQLTMPIRSGAVEGVQNIEITMVLDISSSMNGRKVQDLRDATIDFAETVFAPEVDAVVSINLVPFGGSVNPGQAAYSYLNGDMDPVWVDAGDDGIPDNADDTFMPISGTCLEMEDADYTHTRMPGFDTATTAQSALPVRGRVDLFYYWTRPNVSQGKGGYWCPNPGTEIHYALDNLTDVTTAVNGFLTSDGTGSDIGMKYGVATLDPHSNDLFKHLSELVPAQVPPSMATRPAAYDDPDTMKIMVVMSDGEITAQFEPREPARTRYINNTLNHRIDGQHQKVNRFSKNDGFDRFADQCEYAKDDTRNIRIFTVGFELKEGRSYDELRDCATSVADFFSTSGSGLTETFQAIAIEITKLQLNL